jgi:hypothetical protein
MQRQAHRVQLDRKERNAKDRTRISTSEEYELRYWSETQTSRRIKKKPARYDRRGLLWKESRIVLARPIPAAHSLIPKVRATKAERPLANAALNESFLCRLPGTLSGRAGLVSGLRHLPTIAE